MAELLPPALTKLIDALGNLPGVGPRTAERYAYYLVRHDPTKASQLASALTELHSGIKYCPKTFALIAADQDVSPLYSDPRRDKKIVAVVAEPLDIVALEKTNGFHGTYPRDERKCRGRIYGFIHSTADRRPHRKSHPPRSWPPHWR
jgi:recombination protein RecR